MITNEVISIDYALRNIINIFPSNLLSGIIDFVGERKVVPGYYTYEVNVHDLQEQYGSLTISLKRD